MYFIILATGATLHRAGLTGVQTAAEAAEALRPLAGDAAGALFALGLVGTGLLAVPVLTTSAAYAVAEAFGWANGLNKKPGRARAFYAVIVAATLAGTALNFGGINPMSALVWCAVLNGLLTPPLLVVILLIANNRAVLGGRVNGPALNALGVVTALLMFAAAAGLVWTWFQGVGGAT
jgi:Mn2+/Fe2+ NRAMP family transporter